MNVLCGAIALIEILDPLMLRKDAYATLTLQLGVLVPDAAVGDSIAVDGICLTVTGLEGAGAGRSAPPRRGPRRSSRRRARTRGRARIPPLRKPRPRRTPRRPRTRERGPGRSSAKGATGQCGEGTSLVRTVPLS